MGNRNSGRRPKPTPVLKMQGTYRHYAHDGRGVEAAADGKPTRPSWLDGEARRFWERVVPRIEKLGIGKSIDREELAAMAQWWAIWRLHAKQALTGDVDSLNAAAKAWMRFEAIAGRYGLTPADRIKLRGTEPSDKPVDPATKYFA